MNFSFTVIFPDERYFYYIGTKIGGMKGYILLWLLSRELHKLPFHSFRILHLFANDLDDNFFFFFFGLSKYIRSKYISFFYVNQKLPGRKRFLTIDVILFICIESKVLVANNCRLLNFRLIIYEFFINDTNNNYHGITISENRCLWLLAAYNRAIIYYKP